MNSLIRTKQASFVFFLLLAVSAFAAQPEAVQVPSLSHEPDLPAYLFHPQQIDPNAKGPFPVVIQMHGRAGPYAWGKRRGEVSAENLSARHREWGWFWAKLGFIAIHVDSYSSRGYARGFEKGSYFERPAAVNEISVRPNDALAVREWILKRTDVLADQIGIQGWSNGGSAVLALTLLRTSPFQFAIASYPGCHKIRDLLASDSIPISTPLLLICAGQDDEVETDQCVSLFESLDGPTTLVYYPNATHAFDPKDRKTTGDAMRNAQEFAESVLKRH